MCIIEAVNSRNREAKSVVLVFVDYHEEVGRGGRKRTGGGSLVIMECYRFGNKSWTGKWPQDASFTSLSTF